MRKNILFAAATLFLVCFIALCVGGTAKGQGRDRLKESDYRIMEEELLRDTRQYLNCNGYRNSGVTLTRVVDENGGREYTFTIHHGRIDRMTESDRCALGEELARFCRTEHDEFPMDTCTFRYNFLIRE